MPQTIDGDALRTRIDGIAAERAAQLIELRHHLHANPELSNREERTSAFIAERLRAIGLDEVRTGIAGHGVVGVLRGGRPGERVIALRADMDALPVRETSGVPFASTVVDERYPGGPFPVAHSCGHDCHMAAVLTAASVLAEVRDELPGTVLFVFQPAEEGAPFGEIAGAQAMLDAGALADPEPTMVFGIHVSSLPKGVLGYRIGTHLAASCMVRVEVTGKQVHGSTPWMGVDPLPAAAEIVTASAQLYRQLPAYAPFTLSFGHVQDQGRFNIIGEKVTLWGTIRALVDADLDKVQDKLARLVEHIGAAHGCEATVEYVQRVPAVVNEERWMSAAMPTLTRVLGEDRIAALPPNMGYDDVSVFVAAFGGLYLHYGTQDTMFTDDGVKPVPGGRGMAYNHNPGFYADDEVLLDYLRVFLNVAVDHLHGSLEPASS